MKCLPCGFTGLGTSSTQNIPVVTGTGILLVPLGGLSTVFRCIENLHTSQFKHLLYHRNTLLVIIQWHPRTFAQRGVFLCQLSSSMYFPVDAVGSDFPVRDLRYLFILEVGVLPWGCYVRGEYLPPEEWCVWSALGGLLYVRFCVWELSSSDRESEWLASCVREKNRKKRGRWEAQR